MELPDSENVGVLVGGIVASVREVKSFDCAPPDRFERAAKYVQTNQVIAGREARVRSVERTETFRRESVSLLYGVGREYARAAACGL